jgi:ribosomal protein S18 acetylase RimI-like enzyme
MDTLFIRQAAPDDLELLRDIGIRTFTESFAGFNTAEDMSEYMYHAFHPDRVLSDLSNRDIRIRLAFYEGNVIGYTKTNRGACQSEPLDADHLELERIYVTSEAQGKGVGQMLLDDVVLLARESGFKTLWLGVWERNRGAIRFYERNGFNAFGSHDFMLGKDRQTDILMRRSVEVSGCN